MMFTYNRQNEQSGYRKTYVRGVGIVSTGKQAHGSAYAHVAQKSTKTQYHALRRRRYNKTVGLHEEKRAQR
jgi:hypothetical protein